MHAVVEESGAPVLLAARLKVVDRRITEIETIVVRNQQEGGCSRRRRSRAVGRDDHAAAEARS